MKRKRVFVIVASVAFVIIALCIAVYLLMNSRDFQLFGRINDRVDTDRKAVALTFDDGPTEKTAEILELLDSLEVKCTFFLAGRQIEENRDYAAAIAAAGHQIGNHSYSHDKMIFKSGEYIADEIDRTNSLIREAGYGGEIVFRPPYCKKLLMLPLALQERGMATVTFDVEPESHPEASENAESIADYVEKNAKGGSIILLHVMYDKRGESTKAVRKIVEAMRAQGYEFLTVNELLGLG